MVSVPEGPKGTAFFKLKHTLRVSMDSLWPQGWNMMVPNSVWTSNDPRSLKILKAPCTFTFNLLQYGCLWNTFDLRVGARWTFTVSGPPWTPLMSLKVRGRFIFLSSNPYNMAVYWLLSTSGITHDWFWQCPDHPGPKVPEGPEGTTYFYRQIPTKWLSMDSFRP